MRHVLYRGGCGDILPLLCSTYVGSGFGGNFENRFKISSALYPSGIKQLPDGVRIVYYRTNPRQKHLFKYVAPKTGEVTVYLPYIYGSFVKMLNASQKPISHLEQVSAYSDDGLKQEFYVQKGKTYYFEVTANGASDQLQNIKASVRPLRFKQIRNKKSSAIIVKKRRLIKGMFANGGKSDAWYKIKASADEKLKITASCKSIGGLRLCVYDKDGKNAADKKDVQIKDGTAVNIKAQKSKKAFYYIKISKIDRYGSGRFAFKVKPIK